MLGKKAQQTTVLGQRNLRDRGNILSQLEEADLETY